VAILAETIDREHKRGPEEHAAVACKRPSFDKKSVWNYVCDWHNQPEAVGRPDIMVPMSGGHVRSDVFPDFEAPNGDSLRALGCVLYNVTHLLALLEVAVSFPFDPAEMDKDLLSIIVRRDETVSFDPTEPLD
jgi:hypothetical protein